MTNLEQIIELSFFDKIRDGLNRVKQSTFNKIAVYSLAGVLGAGLGYSCGGDNPAGQKNEASETYGADNGTDSYQAYSEKHTKHTDVYPVNVLDVFETQKNNYQDSEQIKDVLEIKPEGDQSDLKDTANFLDLGSDDISAGYDVGKSEITENIPCGTYTCKAQVEVCCVDVLSGKGPTCIDAQYTCEGTAITCNGPEDCIDTICCAEATFKTDIIKQETEVNGNTKCTPYCNFSFTPELLKSQVKITARVCHDSSDCIATEPVCCDLGDTGMCLTTSAAALAEEYTYGLMDCK